MWCLLTLWYPPLWRLPPSPSSCSFLYLKIQTILVYSSCRPLSLLIRSLWLTSRQQKKHRSLQMMANLPYQQCSRLHVNEFICILHTDILIKALPSKSLRSSKISRSLSLITFPFPAFTSLSGTKVRVDITKYNRDPGYRHSCARSRGWFLTSQCLWLWATPSAHQDQCNSYFDSDLPSRLWICLWWNSNFKLDP